MSIIHKIGKGMNLVPINSFEKSQVSEKLNEKCIMCRDHLTEDTRTVEHIYPKWLQHKFKLWNKKINLPNGTTFDYRNFVVPCCKKCNGGRMSEWENLIKSAVEKGYEEFVKIEEEVIVWWIIKLYYSKVVKESMLKENIKSPYSEKMVKDEILIYYNTVYYYMSELIKGIKFNDPKPYELYIFKTEDTDQFDYIDDVRTNIVYLHMNDILIICAIDSFNFYKVQYENEIIMAKKLRKVHPLQALEIFSKMVYFKMHYKYDTNHSYCFNGNSCNIDTELRNIEQIREFDIKYLYDMLVEIFQLRGFRIESPNFIDGKMISLILEDGGIVKDFYQ